MSPRSLRLTLLVLLACAACFSCLAGCNGGPDRAAVAADATHRAAQLPGGPELERMVNRAIDGAVARRLNPKVQSAWQVVHGLLAFGPDLLLESDGKTAPALDWLFTGRPLTGWNLTPGEKGLEAILEAGSKTGQGHEDQWIGYLSQCGVTPADTLQVRGQKFTVADLVSQAKWDIYEGMEATWTLMAFGTWLPLDATWKAKDGSEWSLERIVAMEAGEPLGSGGCGGSHRLYALAAAVERYRREHGELYGGWQVANGRVQEAVDRVKEFRQQDGSFSTNYFERAGTTPELQTRLSTTGHTLEFLMVALPDEDLHSAWVTQAVVHLCEILEATQEFDLECGGLYHTAHGLDMYRQRRFGR